MSVLEIFYYSFSILLWLGLTIMLILVFRGDFISWLQGSTKAQYYLLGVEQLPQEPVKILRRFYGFLCGGWTWILLWAWWLMPEIKDYFYKSISNEMNFKIARISTLIVIAAYAAAGFFAIGKAITIWYQQIYSPLLSKKQK